jgi:hypothetical protein
MRSIINSFAENKVRTSWHRIAKVHTLCTNVSFYSFLFSNSQYNLQAFLSMYGERDILIVRGCATLVARENKTTTFLPQHLHPREQDTALCQRDCDQKPVNMLKEIAVPRDKKCLHSQLGLVSSIQKSRPKYKQYPYCKIQRSLQKNAFDLLTRIFSTSTTSHDQINASAK